MLKWFGTATSIIGAFLVAGMLPQIGYIFFMLGSFSWLLVGIQAKDFPLISLNFVFFLANIVGVINYIVR